MSVVFDIASLQEADDHVAALQHEISSIQDKLAHSETVANARRQLEHVESRIAQHEKNQRRLDGEAAGLTARIEPEEKRLFSGSVTSSKELMGIEHEVEVLRKKRSELEDQILDLMGRLESLEPRRAAAQRELEAAEKARAEEEAALQAKLTQRQAELETAQQQRDEKASRVQPGPLATYQRLRQRRGGTVVTRLQGPACGGCRVGLPDAVRKQVLTSEAIVQCPNCEKILTPG